MKHIERTKIIVEGHCVKILYVLVFTLVFEGIIRKAIPPLKLPVFFLKDVVCIIGIYKINNIKISTEMTKLRSKWFSVFVLFLPLLFFTAWKDIFLAIFAAKQYLLYVVTGILIVAAFPIEKEESFRKFIFICSLLIIPTALVAILQNSLPPSHWLNLSVGGENLKAFSAGGRLRVGSTFSFTAQYSWFLVAETFILITSYFLPPEYSNKFISKIMPFVHLVLLIMLVVSTFITGGRTAVLGCASTLALGSIFIGKKKPSWFVTRALPILFIGIVSLTLLRAAKPEFFAAYDARSKGTTKVSHNEEVEGRVIDGFTSWTKWFWEQDFTALILGNGLGIMSNGSDQVSSYAAEIRSKVGWTEGDVPTTFWEGGFYLAFVWYGFRIYIMLVCYRLWRSIQNAKLASAAALPLAYVIITGLTGTISMQPPMAIWWWLAVGFVFFIHRFEKHRVALLTLAQVKEHEEADLVY